MSELQIDKIGLKVGLEIHQQLATGKKLFCNCMPIETDEYTINFSRKLRVTKSELGKLDPSAIFEKNKEKTITYFGNPQSSCLVEQDDEPPHDLEKAAKETALIISCALNSDIFNEIYVMRKIVIDGSNTSGFQRTMLVSLNGKIQVDGKKIGIQSICLEEDASRLLKDSENTREYSLDRLGIPLVEIASEPISGKPEEIKNIALALGRLLRATKRVARGLGSIRQDVNVSIEGGGGVVEVKGVQKLDQLEKVIEYEAKRQHGLLKIKEKVEKITSSIDKTRDVKDATDIFRECKSKIIQKALSQGSVVKVIKVAGFSKVFGYEPYPGIRLGKQLGELVRFYGLGGIFHSDEDLHGYGIDDSQIEKLKQIFNIGPNDAFLILAGDERKMNVIIDSLISRIDDSKKGVPAETRAATLVGETVFLRPRPGASRMYPETDILPIIISKEEIEDAKSKIPKSWEEMISSLQKQYDLNNQLATQIFDSEYLDLFENICNDKKVPANFVASALCSTITNLERKIPDYKPLRVSDILETFNLLKSESIAKESLEIIFESLMSGKAKSLQDVIKSSALETLDEKELDRILDDIIESNLKIIREQGTRSMGPLMGLAMKSLRGKVDGQKLNQLLENKIKAKII